MSGEFWSGACAVLPGFQPASTGVPPGGLSRHRYEIILTPLRNYTDSRWLRLHNHQPNCTTYKRTTARDKQTERENLVVQALISREGFNAWIILWGNFRCYLILRVIQNSVKIVAAGTEVGTTGIMADFTHAPFSIALFAILTIVNITCMPIM